MISGNTTVSFCANDIEREGQHLNQMLENIYNRMQVIFEFMDSNPEKEYEKSEY